MLATLQKWGNSHGIRVPKQLLNDLDIKVNDKLNIEVENDKMIIKKEKTHKTLKERLEDFYKKPISKIKKIEVEEIDTGSPVGDEIW